MNSAFATSAKIVILSGNPEDRDGLCVALAQATCQFHRRERFVYRVEWPGKQTRLLAGDNCQAIRISQQLDVSQRLRAGAPPSIHLGECVAEDLAVSLVRREDFRRTLGEFVMKSDC